MHTFIALHLGCPEWACIGVDNVVGERRRRRLGCHRLWWLTTIMMMMMIVIAFLFDNLSEEKVIFNCCHESVYSAESLIL